MASATASPNVEPPKALTVRPATVSDAATIWTLVRDSGILDVNSPYAYLLACRHHGGTCVVADDDGHVAGFVIAYRPPAQPRTVFVWQVGVADSHRRRGLGRQLLHGVLARDACREVRYLEATVTPSNEASMRLFRGVARDLDTAFDLGPCFASEDFPPGEAHEPEHLVRIGPFAADRPTANPHRLTDQMEERP